MRKLSIIICTILFAFALLPVHTFAEHAEQNQIKEIMENMTPEQKIGQLVMPNTHANIRQQPDKNMEELLTKYHVGSVIIYDYYDAVTTANYTNQLQKWAAETEHGIPLFISADLEFGAVQHVTDATVFPRLMGIGATNDPNAAKKVGEITAKEAKAVGYNWNYSPAVDVNVNPLNPVIGVRAFGESIDLVTDLSLAMIEGHQKNGVLATAKHFPGHGDTFIDTHYGLDIVTYDRKTLDDVHLPPFKAAIEAGVDSIMTSHIIVEAIDPELPATLSEKVLTGLLREELAFDGLIITDAMDMGAMVNNYGRGEAAVKAIKAGADVIIAKGTYNDKIATIGGLYDAYESGELTIERINESVERILSKKLKYNLFEDRLVDVDKAKEIVDTPEHKQFASEVAQQSMTLLKNDNVLPFDSTSDDTTLVIGPVIYNEDYYIKEITEEVARIASGKVERIVVSENPNQSDIDIVIDKAKSFDRIIVTTFSASELPDGQAQLVNELTKIGKPIVAFSLGLPYDIAHYPDVDAYIATYAIERWGSPVPTAWTAAVEVIFGAQPGGKLPVMIEDFYNSGDGIDLKDDSTTEKDKEPEAQPDDGAKTEHDTQKSSYFYIIIGAIIVVVISAVLLFVRNKKSN